MKCICELTVKKNPNCSKCNNKGDKKGGFSMAEKLTKEWLDYIEILEGELKGQAECPCCGEDKVCEEDCSIEEDDPNYYEQMQYAREILASKPKA